MRPAERRNIIRNFYIFYILGRSLKHMTTNVLQGTRLGVLD